MNTVSKVAWVGVLAALYGAVIPCSALADEIEFNCTGKYDSGKAYDSYDPSTVSVSARLTARMLGDEDAQGNYELLEEKLTLQATNDGNADAGSIETSSPIRGKLDRSQNPKYKDHVKFDLGSVNVAPYPGDGDQPETYLLIPREDKGKVYVQRQGSGHDAYPTIELDCAR